MHEKSWQPEIGIQKDTQVPSGLEAISNEKLRGLMRDLGQIPMRWALDEHGGIFGITGESRNQTIETPITVLFRRRKPNDFIKAEEAGPILTNAHLQTIASALGLSPEDALILIRTSAGKYSEDDSSESALRSAMIETCNLKGSEERHRAAEGMDSGSRPE